MRPLRERARVAFTARRLRGDYKTVFESVPGKRVLGSILDHCGMMDPTILKDNHGRVDAEANLVALGRRQVGALILDILNMDIDDVIVNEQRNAEDRGPG